MTSMDKNSDEGDFPMALRDEDGEAASCDVGDDEVEEVTPEVKTSARKTSLLPTRIWKFSARPCGSEIFSESGVSGDAVVGGGGEARGGSSVRKSAEAGVDQILRTANRYYNALVAIERSRHERYQAIRRVHAPELTALEAAWEAADNAIVELYRSVKKDRQTHFQKNRGEKRRILPPELEKQVEVLTAERDRLSTEAKTYRTAFAELIAPARAEFKRRTTERAGGAGPRTKSIVNSAVLAEMLTEEWHAAWKTLAASDDKAHTATIAARANCGLATGTYLAIEEAVQRAKKDSIPRPPRFHAYDGHGRMVVQAHGSYATACAPLISGKRGAKRKLSMTPAPHDPTKKGDQSKMMVVRLDQSVPRVGCRKMVMTVALHRIPPSDAVIKWAALVARRIGERNVYELQLTLEHASFAEPKRPAGMRTPAHIQIGWTSVEGGIRVAHYCSETGSEDDETGSEDVLPRSGSDVVLPIKILQQHDFAAAVESAADLHFEHIKRMLRRWMGGSNEPSKATAWRAGPHALTAWHRIESDHARLSFRHACLAYARYQLGVEKVAALWEEWKSKRLSSQKDLYAPASVQRRWLATRGLVDQSDRAAWALYTWARKDEHLRQYAADSRRRYANRRDAFYRGEAIRIATEFESVSVDNYKIAGLKQLPLLTMPGDAPRDQTQHNVQAAAPGRFREILLDVMGSRCTPCERPGGIEKPVTARKRKVRGKKGEVASAARKGGGDVAVTAE